MSKKLLIIAGAVVLLGAGGGGAYFMMSGSEPAAEAAEVDYGSPALVAMEPFMVNINDPGGERYAKVSLQLSVAPSSLAGEITEDPLTLAKMRDRVLTLLTSKSYDELKTPIGKEGFRREIKLSLAPLVEEGEIQDVLFQDFVVQ